MDREVRRRRSGDDRDVRSERQAGLAVEQVKLVERQAQVDDIAGPDAMLRTDDGHDILVGGRDVEELLVAEVLDDVGSSLERPAAVGAAVADIEMLRPEARDERLACLRRGRLSVAPRERDRPAGRAREHRALAAAIALDL